MESVLPFRSVTIEVEPPDLEFVVDAAMRALRVEVAKIEREQEADTAPGSPRRVICVGVIPSPALIAVLTAPGAFIAVRG